jgi:drug/metabolite transporter (DMT)-like permease
MLALPYANLDCGDLFALSFITYFLLSLFGQMTGGSAHTFLESIRAVLRPLPLALLLISNLFFASALYVGFKFTPYAIPSAIAIGVIASFLYSILFLGATVTWLKIVGVILIVGGIYLLR